MIECNPRPSLVDAAIIQHVYNTCHLHEGMMELQATGDVRERLVPWNMDQALMGTGFWFALYLKKPGIGNEIFDFKYFEKKVLPYCV